MPDTQYNDDEYNDDLLDSPLEDTQHQDSIPGGGVVIVNGIKTAWGLRWSAGDLFLDNEDKKKKSSVKEGKERGHDEGADLICTPDKNEFYWGFGSTEYGMKRGMKPLAAIVAKSIKQRPFLGMFYIPDAKAYYIIGLISHDSASPDHFNVMEGTDILLSHEDDINDVFSRNIQHHFSDSLTSANGLIVAPDDYTERPAQSEVKDIKDVVAEGANVPVKLVDISNKRLYMLSGVSLIALLAIGTGFVIYHKQQEALIAKQEQLRKEAQIRIRRQIQERIKNAVTDKKYPYDNRVMGVYALSECETLLKHVNFEAPGWRGIEAQCDPSAGVITATYHKTHGDMDWLELWMKEKSTFPSVPTVTFDSSGTTGTVIWKADNFFNHRYGKHEKSGDIKKEWNYIHSMFAHYTMPVDLKISYASKPQPIQGAPDNIRIPVFDVMNINFSSYYAPSDFISIFAPVNKIVLNNLSISLTMPTDHDAGHRWGYSLTSYQLREDTPIKNKNFMGYSR